MSNTKTVVSLIEELEKLPGVGKRSAERLAYHILRSNREAMLKLADAIRAVKTEVRYCELCFNLSEGELCDVCLDPDRDDSTICVVAQPQDLAAIEATGEYDGLYHVLLGVVNPLEGVGPGQLTVESLVDRVAAGGVSEVIVATNPTFEGDGTALHVAHRLLDYPDVKVTRIARGMAHGSSIEFANNGVLADALTERKRM